MKCAKLPERVCRGITQHLDKVVTSALTRGKSEQTSKEFEVTEKGGVFVGIDPATEEENTIFRAYIYVADPQYYSREGETALQNDEIQEVRKELLDLISDTLENKPIEWEGADKNFVTIESDQGVGVYYYIDCKIDLVS